LIEEFAQADEGPPHDTDPQGRDKDKAQTYALTMAFYATWSFPEQNEP
jgi:hypothetical protein